MDTLTQITTTERQLHAAKGRLRQMRNDNWITKEYKKQPVDQAAIQQTEQEVTKHRKTLAKLYQLI